MFNAFFFFSFCYNLPFTVGPNIFFLGAAEGWGFDFGAAEAFLDLGCREPSPRISQYLLHWCKALNWSMKDVAQFPLKPLYLQQKATLSSPRLNIHNSSIKAERCTHPFLQVAIPTSVSLMPTPKNKADSFLVLCRKKIAFPFLLFRFPWPCMSVTSRLPSVFW